ncbi:MAG: DNA gyrase [Eubacteriales bacterium]|nr:DNA gyrase [Eubacteriales bacterium]
MSITTENRRESYEAIMPTLTKRQQTVLLILQECGDLTAQETATELHRRDITPTDERNFSAPRLTELADKGLVTAVGKKICDKTGRRVTVWSTVQGGEDE